MKLLSLHIFCLALILGSVVSAHSQGYVAQERDFGHYTTLIIDLRVNIEVDGSQPSHGMIVASKADLENIKWEILGEALIISAKDGKVIEGPINLMLGGPALARVESTFESIIYMHDLDNKNLDLDILKGTVKLEGRVANLNVRAEKGKVYASSLESKNASVSVWDDGSVVVHATESLEVEATNSGKVIYSGRPLHLMKSATDGAIIISEDALQQREPVEYVNFGV